MASLRFPGTSLLNGWLDFGGATGGWSPAPTGSTAWIARNLEQARVYVAPARYSSVRKVVFAITFQHLQSGGTLATTFRARIGPPATVDSSRATIESIEIAPGDRPVTVGAGQVWTNTGPDADAAFYPLNGTENQVEPRQVAFPRATTDAQICYVEFDRDNPLAADFFTDWDAVAALGDDRYIAYAAGIQRDDGGTFVGGTASADTVPTMVGVQMVVVQAPSAVNDSCTHVQATNGLYPDENFTFRQPKMVPFTYRASDWDGLEAVHIFLRQTSRSGAITEGEFRVEVREVTNEGAFPGTLVYSEDFGPGVTTVTLAARTANLLSSLVDGRTYVVGFASLSGSSAQDLPWGWWEIIQKNLGRKASFHFAGSGNPASAASIVPNTPPAVGDYRYSVDQSVFDPSWWQNVPDAWILARRWFGGLDHQSDNDTDLRIALNPSLTADITASAGNQVSDEVSSTPDADGGLRIRNLPISETDPINLAGIRVLKLRYNREEWDEGGGEIPGGAGFSYTFFVPNSETLELGPVFEIGEFNPVGCASTAAGLGDNPGVLVLANGSTLPKKFDPRDGSITNAGIDTPFRDEEPTASAASVSLSPAGGLTPGTYRYRYTLRNCCTGKESDPNPVDIVVDGSAESPGLEIALNFNGVVIPADPQICEICIYRTILDGDFPVMAKVGCFNPDETTVFVDQLPDTELDFTNDALSTFNAPPPCCPVVAEFRNRLFMLGDIPNLNPPGTVSVEAGSDVLVGDTEAGFDRCVIGRFIQIAGDCTAYEVLEILGVEAGGSPDGGTRLLLDRPYEGTTGIGLSYIVCGHPNRLYISEPLEPECWPAINFLDVDPGDGDRLTAAISNFNRLVITKRRKTYVVAFREQPIAEIVVPTLISKDIGCIAPRSVAQVANGSVWLAERGLAIYDGRGVQAIPEVSAMNDLFTNPDNPNYMRRDENGLVLGAAGAFYPKREQYLLLIPTVKTQRGASLVLVWDTELRNVTLLEFCQEFLSIEVARDAEGNERVYLGDTNGFVWIWDVGDTDGVGFPNATGTVRGTITEAGIDPSTGASFLGDSTASFLKGGLPGLGDLSGLAGLSGLDGRTNMGVAGACVFWRPADAELDTPWKSRYVYASTPTRLYVTPNWGDDTPDVGDDYMLGPIRFDVTFKPNNYGTDDFSKREWRQIVVHEPEAVSTMLRTELLRDFQNSDADEDTVTDAAGETGAGRTFDLGFGQGRQIRPVGRLVHQYMGVRLSNFAPEEPLTILNHALGVTPRSSR